MDLPWICYVSTANPRALSWKSLFPLCACRGRNWSVEIGKSTECKLIKGISTIFVSTAFPRRCFPRQIHEIDIDFHGKSTSIRRLPRIYFDFHCKSTRSLGWYYTKAISSDGALVYCLLVSPSPRFISSHSISISR